MALISFKEWRGQRGAYNPDHDKRKSAGRPKGRDVGGNPRYGRSRGNDLSTSPKKNTEYWKALDRKEIQQDLEDKDKCNCK